MSFIMVDVEADGPIPGDYSMLSIGAVVVEEGLKKTFYAELKPISDKYNSEKLSYSGFTREQAMKFEEPKAVMERFARWIKDNSIGRPVFISDNNGFDWMFVCWYFWHFIGENPFGFSSQNLGSLYKGMVKDFTKNFKHLRETRHTHNALDDAKGNAESLLKLKKQGLRIEFE
ncbi:MAG: 3'-5' exoribonuclease [Nanoarchaeota archaeon]